MQNYYLYVCPKCMCILHAIAQVHKLNHLLNSYSIYYKDKQVSYLHILFG